MAANTTSTLTGEMMTFLQKTFLERSQQLNIHGEGAKEVSHSKNNGASVKFNRYSPLTAATTALTEGVNPSESNISGATVTATVAEYGNYDKISSLLNATSIDRAAREKTNVIAQNASETIDTLDRNELYNGATVQFAGGKSALSSVAASDVLSVVEIRKAVRALKKKNAMVYGDGYFLGKVGPDTAFDLQADSTWVNAHTYKDGAELYKGELGKLHRVRFLEASSNQKSESSTVTVFSNFIHGQEAFGRVKLDGDNFHLIIKEPTGSDTSNPLDMFMTVGWKADGYAVKTLNADWIVNVKSAAS